MMSKDKFDSVFRKAVQQAFKPRTDLTLWEWMEENIVLESITSATPGPYSFDSCPWLKEVCNSVENEDVETVVGLKCTQSNFTQLACNIMLWWVATYPISINFFTATQDLYKKFVNEKFLPTLQSCKGIQEYRSQEEDDETFKSFKFPGRSILQMGTGGSVASVASSAAGLIIIDEASKWKDSKSEGSTIGLALQRSRTFKHQRKHIIISTPAEESTCKVWAEYCKGDMRVLKFKSPHTGEYFEIDEHCLQKPEDCKTPEGEYDWEKIEDGTWLSDPTTREYGEDGKVTFVGKPITKYDRASLLENWQWVPTNKNPKDKKCHSYHLSAFYSNHVSWGELLVKYIQGQDDIEARKILQTQFFAKPWVQRVTSANVSYINEIIKNGQKLGINYGKGQLPFTPAYMYGACDTQKSSHPWVIEALCNDGKAYVIDYGEAADLETLKLIAQREYAVTTDPKGQRYSVDRMFIDDGGFGGVQNTELRDFTKQSGYLFMCCKGTSRLTSDGTFSEKQMMSNYKLGYIEHKGDKAFPILWVKDSEYKHRLISQYFQEGKTKLYFPNDVSEEFKRQITAESFDEVGMIGGMPSYEWRSHGPNHYLDCIKYCEAARDTYELHLTSEPKLTPASIDTVPVQ